MSGAQLTWLPSDPIPPEILTAAADPEMLFCSHNDSFERQIEAHILHPHSGWPIIPMSGAALFRDFSNAASVHTACHLSPAIRIHKPGDRPVEAHFKRVRCNPFVRHPP